MIRNTMNDFTSGLGKRKPETMVARTKSKSLIIKLPIKRFTKAVGLSLDEANNNL